MSKANRIRKGMRTARESMLRIKTDQLIQQKRIERDLYLQILVLSVDYEEIQRTIDSINYDIEEIEAKLNK